MVSKEIPIFSELVLELQSNCNRDCFFCNRVWDDSGKRIGPDGKSVIRSMPTESVLKILNEVESMGYRGRVTFHHMSEPFLDHRIIDIAWEAKKRGLRPFEHTNGDVLRGNDDLCTAAAEVFEYIVVGIYDHKNESEMAEEKQFWQQKLRGTQVSFSEVGNVYPRTLTPDDSMMAMNKVTYPKAACANPLLRMMIHYDGNMALCCEDMRDEFDLGNAFDTSIEDLWYSDKHTQIIKDLQKGLREKYSLCSKCPAPPPHTELEEVQ